MRLDKRRPAPSCLEIVVEGALDEPVVSSITFFIQRPREERSPLTVGGQAAGGRQRLEADDSRSSLLIAGEVGP